MSRKFIIIIFNALIFYCTIEPITVVWRVVVNTTIDEEFKDALERLEKDAKDVGMTITSICRETGVSRATPDRWRRHPPKSIELLTKMQSIVEARRQQMQVENKPENKFKSEL